MRALAILLVIHGLIHLLGAAKAFGWAELHQLSQPISSAMGAVWLTAATLFIVSALSLMAWPRSWWILALCAVALSMVSIASSWADAKAGTVPNIIVIAVIAAWLWLPAAGQWQD